MTNQMTDDAGRYQTLVIGPFVGGDAARTWLSRYQAAHPGRGNDHPETVQFGVYRLTAPMRTDDHLDGAS